METQFLVFKGMSTLFSQKAVNKGPFFLVSMPALIVDVLCDKCQSLCITEFLSNFSKWKEFVSCDIESVGMQHMRKMP